MIVDTQWLPFPAVVKARPRLGRRRKAFTPQKTVDFEKKVRRFWSENGHHFGDLPVYVGVEIFKDGMMVTIHELEESVRPVGILGDGDNYLKSLLDGLQPNASDPSGGQGAFQNDKQVEWVEMRFVGVPRKTKKVSVKKQSTNEPANPVTNVTGSCYNYDHIDSE